MTKITSVQQEQAPMHKVNLFDQSMCVINFNKHFEVKEQMSRIVNDIAQTSMNANNYHHTDVYQSPPGLQMNNGFDCLLRSPEMQEFVQLKTKELVIPAEKYLVCDNMWVTFIPPGGMLRSRDYEGVFFGSYFLHSPADSGMVTIESLTPSSYYLKLGNVQNNEFNNNVRAFNMPEASIFLVPSYLRLGTTTNTSNEVAVQINFTLDIVDR